MYVLLDYGDFIDGSTSNTAAPYVQLLLMTDAAAAHADFGAMRLDTTGSHSLAATRRLHDHFGFVIRKRRLLREVQKPDPRCSVVGVALFLLAVWLVARRQTAAYRPLFEPVLVGDMHMHYVTGNNNGPQYADPWSHRI
jgi:hypothetical protein